MNLILWSINLFLIGKNRMKRYNSKLYYHYFISFPFSINVDIIRKIILSTQTIWTVRYQSMIQACISNTWNQASTRDTSCEFSERKTVLLHVPYWSYIFYDPILRPANHKRVSNQSVINYQEFILDRRHTLRMPCVYHNAHRPSTIYLSFILMITEYA